MIAPWGGKCDEPDLVASQYNFIKVVIVDLDQVTNDVTFRQLSIGHIWLTDMIDVELADWQKLTFTFVVFGLPLTIGLGEKLNGRWTINLVLPAKPFVNRDIDWPKVHIESTLCEVCQRPLELGGELPDVWVPGHEECDKPDGISLHLLVPVWVCEWLYFVPELLLRAWLHE